MSTHISGTSGASSDNQPTHTRAYIDTTTGTSVQVPLAPGRQDLYKAYDRLRATLAKAERNLHLGQPIRSTDLYAEAIAYIDELTRRAQDAIENANQIARP